MSKADDLVALLGRRAQSRQATYAEDMAILQHIHAGLDEYFAHDSRIRIKFENARRWLKPNGHLRFVVLFDITHEGETAQFKLQCEAIKLADGEYYVTFGNNGAKFNVTGSLETNHAFYDALYDAAIAGLEAEPDDVPFHLPPFK